jgi:hypothetical protein
MSNQVVGHPDSGNEKEEVDPPLNTGGIGTFSVVHVSNAPWF